MSGPFAADAALYADNDAVERIPAFWNAERLERLDELSGATSDDLAEWQHIGKLWSAIIDKLETVFAAVDWIERHIDIGVHRVIERCMAGFGLSPSVDSKLTILAKIRPHLNAGFGRCESPIEKIMLLALLVTFATYADDEWREVDGFLDLGDAAILGQQVRIGPYRVDFLFGSSGLGSNRGVVIECDGHDFHERTAGQAQRDKSRDRWLQVHGYMVLRFTGREIFKNAAGCAGETFDALGFGGKTA
jgi:hypothetical protein